MVIPWWTKYIGVPYDDGGRTLDGCDCYGLVRIVYQQELRIEIPSYIGYSCVQDHNYILPKLEEERLRWKSIEKPEDFAVVLWMGGKLLHIGLAINEKQVIHTGKKLAYSCIQSIDKIYGKVDGIYQWVK